MSLYPHEIKSAMSEIELTDEALSGGNKLMNLSLPDNTLVVMVKRGEQYLFPKGHTHLQSGDRLLVFQITMRSYVKAMKVWESAVIPCERIVSSLSYCRVI